MRRQVYVIDDSYDLENEARDGRRGKTSATGDLPGREKKPSLFVLSSRILKVVRSKRLRIARTCRVIGDIFPGSRWFRTASQKKSAWFDLSIFFSPFHPLFAVSSWM